MENGKLYKFMQELVEAGFAHQFVMEQGYYFALQLQHEQEIGRLPLYVGIRALHAEGVTSKQMEQAAAWVAACNLALGIHPVQMDAEQYESGSTRRRR